jgi:Leucine-rich repeat (LRR) protein
MPSLEILDLSRNKIKALPSHPGSLMGLKVLSLSKNRITHLPRYIGKMQGLVFLKVDRNPIEWPPPVVVELPEDASNPTTDVEASEAWLKNLQQFLNENGGPCL